MGSILEVGKITATVWLRKYWDKCGWLLKVYLVPAVVALAVLTSMGIFGFLSKAHMDQGVQTGDAQAKLVIYDEKIKTERDNIDLARKALKQMDDQVDQMLGRTSDDRGAERAVLIRKQQAKERTSLQNEISVAQTKITKLNEERAPVAAETRKVEAEVGPIKYIAALIYGDNLDSNLLERAVRWVIILLVVVFDPLAIALVLAANQSKEWDKEIKLTERKIESKIEEVTSEPVESVNELVENVTPLQEPVKPSELTAALTPDNWDQSFPSPEEIETNDTHNLVYTPVEAKPHKYKHKKEIVLSPSVITTNEEEIPEPIATENKQPTIITDGVTTVNPVVDHHDGYVSYEGKHMSIPALKEMHPEAFLLLADNKQSSKTNFGTEFPRIATKGDVFVRVDSLPNRVFKFNGSKWIEVNKDLTSTYLSDQNYVRFLIDKIDSGEYDVDLLSESEKQQLEVYLKNQQQSI